MDLSLIFTIPGKPGLYKLLSRGKNNAIVESLNDGKKTPMFNLNQVSSLAEIAIYTATKEVELAEIFRSIFKKENGAKTLDHKEEFSKIKVFFEEILPDYDRERVYESNIRKVLQWYNLLLEKGLVDLELSSAEKEIKDTEAKEVETQGDELEEKVAGSQRKKAAGEGLSSKTNTEVEGKETGVAEGKKTTKPAAKKTAKTTQTAKPAGAKAPKASTSKPATQKTPTVRKTGK